MDKKSSIVEDAELKVRLILDANRQAESHNRAIPDPNKHQQVMLILPAQDRVPDPEAVVAPNP